MKPKISMVFLNLKNQCWVELFLKVTDKVPSLLWKTNSLVIRDSCITNNKYLQPLFAKHVFRNWKVPNPANNSLNLLLWALCSLGIYWQTTVTATIRGNNLLASLQSNKTADGLSKRSTIWLPYFVSEAQFTSRAGTIYFFGMILQYSFAAILYQSINTFNPVLRTA